MVERLFTSVKGCGHDKRALKSGNWGTSSKNQTFECLYNKTTHSIRNPLILMTLPSRFRLVNGPNRMNARTNSKKIKWPTRQLSQRLRKSSALGCSLLNDKNLCQTCAKKTIWISTTEKIEHKTVSADTLDERAVEEITEIAATGLSECYTFVL